MRTNLKGMTTMHIMIKDFIDRVRNLWNDKQKKAQAAIKREEAIVEAPRAAERIRLK